jgi:hypothetical protein
VLFRQLQILKKEVNIHQFDLKAEADEVGVAIDGGRTDVDVIKRFFSSSPTARQNKLERFFVASFFSSGWSTICDNDGSLLFNLIPNCCKLQRLSLSVTYTQV